MFLSWGVHSPSTEGLMVSTLLLRNGITIVTTIASNHLPWSHADLHSKGKRGIFRSMEGTGVQIPALPLLSQEAYDHSTQVIWEEFNKDTLYSAAGGSQRKQQDLNFQIIPELATSVRQDIMTSRPEGARWGEVYGAQRELEERPLDRNCGLQ